jgi:hypothetical protein
MADKQQIKEKDGDVVMMIMENVFLLRNRIERTVEVYLASYSKVSSVFSFFFSAHPYLRLGSAD